MSIRRLLPLLVAWTGWIAPDLADACSCYFGRGHDRPRAVRRAAADADAVFEGTARTVEVAGGVARVEFEVRRRWRGADGARSTVETPAEGAACGYPFEPGVSYLVFAQRTDAGALHVGRCGYTEPTAHAGRLLAALGEGAPPGSPAPPTSACDLRGAPGSLSLPASLALLGLSRRRRSASASLRP